MNVRAWLYRLARLLGDVRAVERGRVGQRLWNRSVGRASRRILRRLWK
jgi:hypothetical protein